MNPTEKFLEILAKLIKDYEKETGARILNIKLERYKSRGVADMRSQLLINSIDLEMV
jgi:hypothetical protein